MPKKQTQTEKPETPAAPLAASEFVTVRQTMELLGVSRPTVYRLIRKSELHSLKRKFDRRIYFARREVEAVKAAMQIPTPVKK